MTETKVPPTKAYPKDPLRVDPEVKQQITKGGMWIYADTCCECANYSEFYHGCKIRDTNRPDNITTNPTKQLSVTCGYKCKHWRKA